MSEWIPYHYVDEVYNAWEGEGFKVINNLTGCSTGKIFERREEAEEHANQIMAGGAPDGW